MKTAIRFLKGLSTTAAVSFFISIGNFFFVNQNPRKEAPIGAPATDIFLDEQAVLERWGAPDAVYLIIEQDRVAHWKKLLIERFHIYHQITASGTYVVLSNQL